MFGWKKNDRNSQGVERRAEPSSLLTGDPEQDTQTIQILLDTIAELTSTLDLDRILEDIVDKSLEFTRGERGILLLGDRFERLRPRVARDRDGNDLGTSVVYSQTLVQRCMERGQPERSTVNSDQEALELGQSVFNLRLRAVMCAPLKLRGRTIGAVYIDSTATRREFSGRDLALFGAMSAQLASAVETAQLHADSLEHARKQRDLETARQIQKHLLAPVPRDFAGGEVAVRFYARDEASGDTYDFVSLADGRLVALIGDVTGHGVGAALLTHAAQAAVRSYLELIDDLSEVATRLNNRLVASIESGNFMSMLLVLVDPAQMTMHYVNAGHQGVILVRGDEVREFEQTGTALGLLGDQRFGSAGPIGLEPGDLLVMRTDGVDETRNAERELFGAERLHATLRDAGRLGAEEALAAVERAATEFAAGLEQDDDLTMVAIRIGGGR